MLLPTRKDNATKRKEELQRILNPGGSNNKPKPGGRVSRLRQYFARHYKIAAAATLLSVCLFTQLYYFNKLTVLKQQAINLRAQIEGGLQMRQNIIPSLTVAVNQFISHERGVFLAAVKAREDSLSVPKDMEKLTQTLKGISGTAFSPSDLSRFMAVAENYPQLVSSQSYQLLIGQIAEVENQIYQKRVECNDAVNNYNTCLSTFPANMAGRVMGFRSEPYFTWDKEAEWISVTNAEAGEPPLTMKTARSDADE